MVYVDLWANTWLRCLQVGVWLADHARRKKRLKSSLRTQETREDHVREILRYAQNDDGDTRNDTMHRGNFRDARSD